MGKHALVVLCAAFALAALATRGGGQEEPKPKVPDAPEDEPPASPVRKAGTFLTPDDLEHLDAALGYVNLTREQLHYEKKHADHKLRLSACDRALDEPLKVPSICEEVSAAFSTGAIANARAKRALRMLDASDVRWTELERLKDDSQESKLAAALGKPAREAPANDEDARKDLETLRDIRAAALMGGAAKRVDGEGSLPLTAAVHVAPYLSQLAILTRVPETMGEEGRTLLGGAAGGLLAPHPLPLPGTEARAEQWFDTAAGVDIASKLLAASDLWSRLAIAAGNWQEELDARPEDVYAGKPSSISGIAGGIVACWQGPWGKFVIGGTGPNTYEGDDFIGIIDLGGDDIYRGRVASGIGLPGRSPISFVLDLGGNDRYEGEDFTQGFGFLGMGILHDLGGGNDTYKARFCSQGCGLCGYGELYDDGGDDFYQADSGVQGAGVFGYGHLIDARGNDVYRACRYAQAFAQVKGVGVLTDGAGNDLYYAGGKYLHQPLWNDRYQSLSQGFAIGNRNEGTGGGVALLLDEGDGNDVYQADIYGQGSSYWYSLGMLVDKGGNDTYTLGQYGQGGGIHLSAGILVDLAGNDTYTNPFGVGTGGAHDWAVGWLIDRAGNDLYQGNGQGQGLNYAIGILLDCAGNDSRSTNNEGSIGKGHNNDISLVLDLGGTDNYGSKEIIDGEITRRGDHALVYDVPEGWFPGIDPSTWPTPQNPAPEKAVVQHILIAWDGTGVDTQKQKRTKEEATALMRRVMKQSRSKGADWKQLQADYNEDCSKGVDDKGEPYDSTHNKYTVTPTARLVKPFLDLSLKLGVGQIDVCESKYGWHIIKRVE